jgi:hypothetical protein
MVNEVGETECPFSLSLILAELMLFEFYIKIVSLVFENATEMKEKGLRTESAFTVASASALLVPLAYAPGRTMVELEVTGLTSGWGVPDGVG